MRASAPLGVLAVLAAPAPAWALGLGDIELHSALNQPFRADIQLSATASELENLRIALADRATFEAAGLDRPAFMSGFSFDVGRNVAGQTVVRVASRQPVQEPFVTMIVEAAVGTQIVRREFTVFIDPPVLLPAPTVQTPITSAVTGGAEPGQSAATISRLPATPPSPAAVPEPTQAPRPQPSRSAPDSNVYGPIQRNETLWGIAELYQPAGVTINQTMVAIYQANPDAFLGNMNLLRAGATVRIPSQGNLATLSSADATAEVRRQTDSWRGRQGADQQNRLVLRPADAEPSAAGAGAGARAGGGVAAGGGADAQAVAALQSEVEALRSELGESERLLEVRNQELAALQEQLEEAQALIDEAAAVPAPPVPAAGGEVFAGPEPVVEPAVEPVVEPEPEPVAEPSLPPVQTAPPAAPSLVSRVVGWLTTPFVLIGLGIAALLIAVFAFMRRRREDVLDATGQWDAIEAGMEETAVPRPPAVTPDEIAAAGAQTDFVVEEQAHRESTTPIDDPDSVAAEQYEKSQTASMDDTLSTTAVINLDEADPVAEADFHMAYGLYDQAADLLSTALKEEPDRQDLQLKLLEVFFVWGNKDEFLDAAEHLRAQMGDVPSSDWDKVIIMGKQICPEAELFADAPASGGAVDLSVGDSESSLDFAFDDTGEHGLDLDIGEMTGVQDLDSTASSPVDLDLTGDMPQLSVDPTETLKVGDETAESLVAALRDDDEEGGPGKDTEALPGIDPESLVATQETPTLEVEDDDGTEDPLATFETEILEPSDAGAGTTRLPSVDQPGSNAPGDFTAEIDVNELGLDVNLDSLDSDLDSLGEDFSEAARGDDRRATADAGEDDADDTREQPALTIGPEELTATGVAQVLQHEMSDEPGSTQPSKTGDEEGDTRNQLGVSDSTGTALFGPDSAATSTSPGQDDESFALDDLSRALDAADTMEQPQAVSDSEGGDAVSTGSEDMRSADPQTMTEVGTKLDLARAYIDMGDPDGARSILEEVLAEGDSGQRQEAQSLMDALTA